MASDIESFDGPAEEDRAEASEPGAEIGEGEAAAAKPKLSEKQIAAIRKQAREAVEREFLAKERDRLLDEEKDKERARLAMHANDHLAGRLSEKVRITIRIPEFSNVPWIQFNPPYGPQFLDGQSYDVPRHVAEQLRETMQYMRRHQNEIDGKSRNRQVESGTILDRSGRRAGPIQFIDAATGAMSGSDPRASVGAAVGTREAA